MKEMLIRRAGVKDATILQQISCQTFTETFGKDNSEENMRLYLEDAFSLEKLSTELAEVDSHFYFAEKNETIVGYLKLNFQSVQTEQFSDRSIEIERIYVLKEHQGKQIGKLLYQTALQVAKEKEASFIWLGVWELNHRAIDFYRKIGFVAFDKHIFLLGEDPQTDILMKQELL